MSFYVSVELRQQLSAVDGNLCAYCHTATENTGQRLTVDHIKPRSQQGTTAFDNICWACRQCNEFKGEQISEIDPLTGDLVALFHPRQDRWADHFSWNEQGTHLIGLTPIGRATIIALNINNPLIVQARRRWVGAGWHPPDTD